MKRDPERALYLTPEIGGIINTIQGSVLQDTEDGLRSYVDKSGLDGLRVWASLEDNLDPRTWFIDYSGSCIGRKHAQSMAKTLYRIETSLYKLALPDTSAGRLDQIAKLLGVDHYIVVTGLRANRTTKWVRVDHWQMVDIWLDEKRKEAGA